MSCIKRVSVAWVIVCLLLLGGHKAGFTQADDALWAEPVNLSRSGAASFPVLVVGPERQIQVFWWDRFDGLTTAYTLVDGWSAPVLTPIQGDEEEGIGLSSSTLTVMPQILSVDETVFALWLGTPDRETGQRALLYSRLRLGTTAWTLPEPLAESALSWEMTGDTQGVLHLVYCQTQQLDTYPAGIYHKHSTDGGLTWSEPITLYTSLYARLWTADTVHLSLAADASSNVLVGWDDPRQESAFYVYSTDVGLSWSETTAVRDEYTIGLHPRFIAMPALSGQGQPSGVVMLWEQASVASTCVLRQQRSEDGGRTWSAAVRVFEDLTSCPVQVVTAQTTTGPLLLLGGEETGYLLAAASDRGQWSALKQLSFSFENPQTGTMTYLESLQANVTPDNTLVVVGQEQGDDIWVLQGEVNAVAWVFAAPSPWSDAVTISGDDLTPGFPAPATDAERNVHVLWSGSPSIGRSGAVLYYSRWDETFWSRPAAVLGADEGVALSPALVFAEPYLHAVWSGGSTGAVFYSRSYPGDAFMASSWSTPMKLGETAIGSTPALTLDLSGRLHVVYAVPFNEGRGIYYTYTEDNGDSWQETVRIFDAVAEGWLSIDRPDVTVDERGVIHVVWGRAPLPGYGLPQGVYYARSSDHGETWTDAMLLADGAYDWPQVAATLTGQVIVTWQDLTRNIVEYRSSSDDGLTWSYATQIPGLQAIEGRAVLAQDGTGRLHITTLNTQVGSGLMLRHLVYAGEQWSGLDSVEVKGVYTPVDGAALSVVGELGLIDVVGLGSRRGDDGLTPVIWHTRRTIEGGAAPQSQFAPAPTATPTPQPTPAPTLTPRPAVDPYPAQPSAPVLALGPITLPLLAFAGIGMALLLVAGVVVIKVMKR